MSLLFTGLLILVTLYVAYKFWVISTSDTAVGTVTEIITATNHTRRNRTTSHHPVVVFQTGGKTYRFLGESNVRAFVGQNVPVLYNRSDPSIAFVYDRRAFWLHPAVLLPFILWIGLVVHLSREAKSWTVSFRPAGITKEPR